MTVLIPPVSLPRVRLVKRSHSHKIGSKCPALQPTVTESCYLLPEDGAMGVGTFSKTPVDPERPLGFYLESIPEHMRVVLDAVNTEFNSERVPKLKMIRRASTFMGKDESGNFIPRIDEAAQYSTILGAIAPMPMMRRPNPTISAVHTVKSARPFIRGMLMLCSAAEELVREYMPEQYAMQRAILDGSLHDDGSPLAPDEQANGVGDQWRFGKMFTSSICNLNIAAAFHRDTGNIKNTVNVIITKRLNSRGGSLFVPEYGAVFEQANYSMLVYPAWRNMHAVTPIEKRFVNGYRNSFIFYPLRAFIGTAMV